MPVPLCCPRGWDSRDSRDSPSPFRIPKQPEVRIQPQGSSWGATAGRLQPHCCWREPGAAGEEGGTVPAPAGGGRMFAGTVTWLPPHIYTPEQAGPGGKHGATWVNTAPRGAVATAAGGRNKNNEKKKRKKEGKEEKIKRKKKKKIPAIASKNGFFPSLQSGLGGTLGAGCLAVPVSSKTKRHHRQPSAGIQSPLVTRWLHPPAPRRAPGARAGPRAHNSGCCCRSGELAGFQGWAEHVRAAELASPLLTLRAPLPEPLQCTAGRGPATTFPLPGTGDVVETEARVHSPG